MIKLLWIMFLCFLWPTRGDPSERCLRVLAASASCCSPQPFIELSFFIRMNSAGSCDPPDHLGEGIRLEIKSRGFRDWQPIRFYALTTQSADGNVTTVINETHVIVDDEGFSSVFRLYTNDSQSPIHVREYICGEMYASNTRFRWVQQYLGIAEENEDTWSIDDITIRYWNGSCYTLVLEEDFENSTEANSRFAIQRGSIENPPCGPTASGKALYFNGRANSSVTRFERRRGNTPVLTSFENCIPPPPLPLPHNHECSVESDSCADFDLPVCSVGRFECRCETGYERNGVSCVDIDECTSEETHNCHQICSNNDGGFECQCRTGYELDDDGVSCHRQNVTIGFEQVLYVVVESSGDVRLNVSVLAGVLSRMVNVTLTISGGSVPSDYTAPGETILQFGATAISHSVSIPIVDDGILERNETFLVELSSNFPEVILNPFRSEVVIVDDSNVTVGFEQTNYSVMEGGSVLVCVLTMVGALERNVSITLASQDGTATSPEDYTEVSIELILSPASEKSCATISTIDDAIVENTETLKMSLACAEPSVTIFSQQGRVEISDNDNLTIGFDSSLYVVDETAGMVTVGVAILEGQLAIPVQLRIITMDGRAISSLDYSALSLDLTLDSSETHQDFPVTILSDMDYELMESFSLSLSLLGVFPSVILRPHTALVEITDDDGDFSSGNISSIEAASELEDLLNLLLESGEPFSRNFSEAFVGFAGSALDSNNIQKNELTVGGRTAVASRILNTLDTFALNVDGELETENIRLAVQEVKGDEVQNVTGIRQDGSEIVLPAEIIRNNEASQVRVASFYFRNLSGVLPDSMPDSNATRLVSPVISSNLGCGPARCPPVNTTVPVRVVLTHTTYQVDTDEPLCVFWQFNRDGDNLTGSWSTNGCSVNQEESNTTATVCQCNHLTHFAILLSPRAAIPEEDVYALQIIGYVGVSISLVCLLMTVVAFLFLRSLRGSMRNYIHINLCISLMISQLTFIVGVDKTANEKACQAVAVLLHYFFLVTFMWMLMEGLVLYVALVKVFTMHQKQYIAAFTIFSYGAPALYMGVVVPLGFALDNGPHYGGDACWLRHDTHFIWAFIAPIIVTILINIGFFIMAIRIMHHHEKKQLRKSQLGTAKHWLKCCISLVLVMGITWIIGVLSFHKALLAVSYIFTIFVAFQGVFIFILFVPLSKQVREHYSRWWKSKVAASEFLSNYFGEMAEHSLSRQLTRLTTARSTLMRESTLGRNSRVASCSKNPSEFLNSHNEASICEKEKVHIPSETAESAVLSNEKLEELEEKKDLRAFLELLENAPSPGDDGLSIPDKGWRVIWKAPSDERSQESPSEEEGTAPSEEKGTIPSEEEGTAPSEEKGTIPSEEEGTAPSEEGTAPSEEEGTAPSEEKGTTPSEEEGTTPSEEEGTAPSDEECTKL